MHLHMIQINISIFNLAFIYHMNPESKKYDIDKRMWTTNYRETENQTVRQKWTQKDNNKFVLI